MGSEVCWYKAPDDVKMPNAKQKARNDSNCVRQSIPDTMCSADKTKFYPKGHKACEEIPNAQRGCWVRPEDIQ
jgi:hypothetical protein